MKNLFILTLLISLQLLLSVDSASNEEKTITTITYPLKHFRKDSIVLINTTNKELGFSYNNKFLDLKRFHLKAFDTVSFYAEATQLITQTNNNQNFYILYPGDTLYASVSKGGDAIFAIKDDSIRNNELNLQWEINDKTPLNFMKILKLRGMYFGTDYKKMDSIYLTDYFSKINFINEYKLLNPISAKYELALKNYYKSFLFARELWIGTSSKAEIPVVYSNYLYSLKDSIKAIASTGENSFYPFLGFAYVTYQLKEIAGSKFYYDSLYANYKKIKDVEKDIKQLLLFKIVKESLEKNSVENWFVKDFIENIADREQKVYIGNLIKNNLLMAAGAKSNSIINPEAKIFSYDSLIKSLENTVIYIDVWASWCAPCRAEMPSSLGLRAKFKNKGIRFIYISIDDNIAAWKTANKEVGLDKYSDSYLLLNAESSNFVKKFKIGAIPRYILINKHGQIENANALRPSDDGIINLFTSLMDK